jgi:hypothetical protein
MMGYASYIKFSMWYYLLQGVDKKHGIQFTIKKSRAMSVPALLSICNNPYSEFISVIVNINLLICRTWTWRAGLRRP